MYDDWDGTRITCRSSLGQIRILKTKNSIKVGDLPLFRVWLMKRTCNCLQHAILLIWRSNKIAWITKKSFRNSEISGFFLSSAKWPTAICHESVLKSVEVNLETWFENKINLEIFNLWCRPLCDVGNIATNFETPILTYNLQVINSKSKNIFPGK